MTVSLTQTMDAREWAKEFTQQYPQMDEELMHTWFANAIMCGYDRHANLRDTSPVWIYVNPITGVPTAVTSAYEDRAAAIKKLHVDDVLYEHTKYIFDDKGLTINQICRYDKKAKSWEVLSKS